MKQCYTLLWAFIALTLNASAQLDQGLIGEFPMAGDAINADGTMNSGQIQGSVTATADRFGSEGCALEFAGTADDFINIDYSSALDFSNNEFSISLWYYGGSEDVGDLELLVTKAEASQEDFGVALYDSNQPVFYAGQNFSIWHIDDDLYMDSTWHHLVAVYNVNSASVYFDGDLVETETNISISNQEYGLQIGQSFTGKLDDFFFYNRPLSAAEVLELYELEGNCGTISNIESTEENQLEIYPNPVTTELNVVRGISGKASVAIYDIQGRVVFTAEIENHRETIDTSGLVSGIYTLTLTGENQNLTQKKFVVK